MEKGKRKAIMYIKVKLDRKKERRNNEELLKQLLLVSL